MFRKYLITLVILLISVIGHGQSREKTALKDLTKHRWSKASSVLRKSIQKDTLNVPALYVMAHYYFNPQNPDFQLDSAYAYTSKAIRIFHDSDEKTRYRWAKFPLDSQKLVDFRELIDSAAFQAASAQNREESYNHFIRAYPLARQKQTAIERRNAVAFQKALEENTYTSFGFFIEKYPEAAQAPLARKNYEQLLFEFHTRDQRLESFERFIKDYPQSPYRLQAERSIFQVMTAPGTPEAFVTFLETHPTSIHAQTAANILFYILAEDHQEDMFPEKYLNGLIRVNSELEKDFLVPFLTKGKFGFMNASGKEIIPAELNTIGEEYLCGNISEDLIVLHDRIVDRHGKTVWAGKEVSSLRDLGYGFLQVDLNNESILLHKTGFVPFDFGIRSARVLNSKMLAIQANEKWGVYAFTGKKLIPLEYDAISTIGNALLLQKKDLFYLATISEIINSTFVGDHKFSGPYEETRRMGENIWVRNGELHGLLDQQLKTVVQLEPRTISQAFFGAIATSDQGYVTINSFGEQSERFSQLEIREPWVSANTDEGWVLFDPVNRIFKSVPYDTVLTYGPFAVGSLAETVEVNFFKRPNATITLRKPERIEFLPGPDSLSFLLIDLDKKSTLYDPEGNTFSIGSYERIQYAGNAFFVGVKKGKKGLINTSGKIILPFEYDAIGTANNGTISLLKAMKFGLLNIETQKLIKPAFDKNIWRYNHELYVAYKGTGLGFIDETGKPSSGFDYSEIHPWSDSVALVKLGTSFQFYNIYQKRIVLADIKEYKVLRDSPDEKLFIVTQKDQVGVISNKRGIVIPINFSDIVNVGSPERPLFFTEKHVKEASIFVVIYYDHEGKMLRREVYEQDEYDRIYCDD